MDGFIEFVNAYTGAPMWVAEDRKEEYIAAGHTLAASSDKPIKPAEDKPKAAPKKATTKRGK